MFKFVEHGIHFCFVIPFWCKRRNVDIFVRVGVGRGTYTDIPVAWRETWFFVARNKSRQVQFKQLPPENCTFDAELVPDCYDRGSTDVAEYMLVSFKNNKQIIWPMFLQYPKPFSQNHISFHLRQNLLRNTYKATGTYNVTV